MGKRASQSFAARAKYTGLKAFCNDDSVGFVPGFYALTDDGKQLLLRGGKPVRLMHVDLAPGDPDDGSEEFLVAGPKDPPQSEKGRIVPLEPEAATAKGKAGA